MEIIKNDTLVKREIIEVLHGQFCIKLFIRRQMRKTNCILYHIWYNTGLVTQKDCDVERRVCKRSHKR